jgi:30S ribosomal protein S31
MGKGDIKSKKGKIFAGSFGNSRVKKDRSIGVNPAKPPIEKAEPKAKAKPKVKAKETKDAAKPKAKAKK